MGITAGGMIILLALSGGLPEIMWLGNDGIQGSAAAAGMGNTVYADDSPQAAIQNPAMASRLPDGFCVGVTGALSLDIEKRTRRVYDSFGGVVGESEHSFNQNFYPLPGGVAVSWKNGDIALSSGWRAVSTFYYDYKRVMNDDNYVRVGQEDLDISGMLSDFGISAAWAGLDAFSFGVGGSFVTGTRSLTHRIEYVDTTMSSLDTLVETSYSGMVVRGSVTADLGRVDVSAGVEQTVGWEKKVESLSEDMSLPMTVRAGFVYLPGNRLMSRFVADLWWSGTESVEVGGVDAGLRNSWGFGAGVANTLPSGLTARVGFGYDSSPRVSALDRMMFTAGLGWMLDDISLDAAVSFSPVRWDQYQVEDLPTFTSGDSLVTESSSTVLTFGLAKAF